MDWTLFFAFLAVFAVGAFVGYKVNEWIYRVTFAEMMAQAGLNETNMEQFVKHWANELGEEVPNVKPQVQIRIEKINDDLFCYEKATDRFLGQGKTRDELIDVLTARLGPVSLLIQPEDGAEYVKEGTATHV